MTHNTTVCSRCCPLPNKSAYAIEAEARSWDEMTLAQWEYLQRKQRK